MQDTTLSPADFVSMFNQTLETAWPVVAIEGELSDFRVSKNRWLYFKLQDEEASVDFFGTVYNLPGPLEDGLTVRVVGAPKFHPRFGFTINVQSIVPVGEGAIKKAAELLRKKLATEGLFDPTRKRLIPTLPEKIGLITAARSAAYSDFLKISNERWGGLEIQLLDVFVQGGRSPEQIVNAIDYFNQAPQPPEVIVITRGGGSLEDLAPFSDERVVRAVATSRTPTIVAIGHEVDVSLAELAADMRASTPSDAAALLVPDKLREFVALRSQQADLTRQVSHIYTEMLHRTRQASERLDSTIKSHIADSRAKLASAKTLAKLLNPLNALKRGYAILTENGTHISSIKQAKVGASLSAQVSDGTIQSVIQAVKPDAKTS